MGLEEWEGLLFLDLFAGLRRWKEAGRKLILEATIKYTGKMGPIYNGTVELEFSSSISPRSPFAFRKIMDISLV